ncbi:MAG TPA: hypothetical protein VGR35_00295 [Tepidisphaeraceae bacterium]|nr:hypothetical protein [Tepidisphaeraceae bacterium]
MSEPLKIALTAVGGVVIFVLGQIIQRLFIEPIQDQRRTIGNRFADEGSAASC